MQDRQLFTLLNFQGTGRPSNRLYKPWQMDEVYVELKGAALPYDYGKTFDYIREVSE